MSQPIALPCLCATLRRASRALTQMYEQALRSEGVRATQFTILQVLSRARELSQGSLGDLLAMDSTTLSRTLAIMLREKWVAERRGDDRRERYLRLADRGEALLERATPVWEKAQSEVRRRLGKQAWDDLQRLANHVTEIATNKKELL